MTALNTLVSESIDVVVHCARGPDGPRVTEIVAVEDLASGSRRGAVHRHARVLPSRRGTAQLDGQRPRAALARRSPTGAVDPPSAGCGRRRDGPRGEPSVMGLAPRARRRRGRVPAVHRVGARDAGHRAAPTRPGSTPAGAATGWCRPGWRTCRRVISSPWSWPWGPRRHRRRTPSSAACCRPSSSGVRRDVSAGVVSAASTSAACARRWMPGRDSSRSSASSPPRSAGRSRRRCSRSGAARPRSCARRSRPPQREWLLSTDFERTLRVLKANLADPTADAVCETLLVAHEVGGTDLDRRLEALVDDRVQDTQGRKDARAKQAGARFARRFVLIVPAGHGSGRDVRGHGTSRLPDGLRPADGRPRDRARRRVLDLGGAHHDAARGAAGLRCLGCWPHRRSRSWSGATLVLSELRWFSRQPLVERLRPYGPGALREPRSSRGVLSVASFGEVVGPLARQIGERLAALLGVSEDLSVRLARTHSPMDATAFRVRQLGWSAAGLAVGALVVVRTRPPLAHRAPARHGRADPCVPDRRAAAGDPIGCSGSAASSSSCPCSANSSACCSVRATRWAARLNRLAARGVGCVRPGPGRGVRTHPTRAHRGRSAARVGTPSPTSMR